ncbi:Exported protein of unknown function [Magnetospira sp. QH-2]|nr:Exported protein of unknown function [Magnetospira sp. QH-2]
MGIAQFALGVTGMALVATTAAAETKPWPQEFYNPKPNDHDLILGMPCKGAMVFRRIDVANGAPMADRELSIGSGEGAIRGTRTAYLAGGFEEPQESGRAHYYYLGKYEVTQDQYDAVLSVGTGKCPRADEEGRRPARRLSWLEAQVFADRYSQWLRAHEEQRLPSAGDFLAHVRLPTEAEWEFAARGGLAVDIPSAGDVPLSQQAHFGSTEPGPQPIGLLQPNPLNLYDMLGNVAEYTLNLFQLTWPNRLHGRIGGATVRGGDYATEENQLGTATREEVPLYRSKEGGAGVNRMETVGFRVVLSAPVIHDHKSLKQIKTARKSATTFASVLGQRAGEPASQEHASIPDNKTEGDLRAALLEAQVKSGMYLVTAVLAKKADYRTRHNLAKSYEEELKKFLSYAEKNKNEITEIEKNTWMKDKESFDERMRNSYEELSNVYISYLSYIKNMFISYSFSEIKHMIDNIINKKSDDDRSFYVGLSQVIRDVDSYNKTGELDLNKEL